MTNELLERYKVAVDGWPHGVDDAAVERALLAHVIAIGAPRRVMIERFGAERLMRGVAD